MQCRVAKSLGGGFAGTPESAWGTTPYVNDTEPTIFFGCYGLPDFYALWSHKGERHVFWAGSDIRHLQGNYWLEDGGGIRVDSRGIAQWINAYCTNWCENTVEQETLAELGILAKVVPSFLGNIDDYEVSYTPNKKYYTSVSGDDWEVYGIDKLVDYATLYPNYEFHLYGNRAKPPI